MAFYVEMAERPDYLLVTVTGSYDLDEAIERFGSVLLACRRSGQNQILVDYRGLTGESGAIEEIIYATGIGDLYRMHLEAGGAPLRIAYLGTPSFIQSWVPGVEVAKGYDLEVCVTIDLDEALEWLAQ